MAEFTLRNKSTRPILTLRPAIFEALLAARPEASSLVWAKYCQDYQALTGKAVSLDHEQLQALLARYGANAAGTWTSRYASLPVPWYQVERTFVAGFLQRMTSAGLAEDLRLAQAFYDLLDQRLLNS